MNSIALPVHPGSYVRDAALTPKGLSVSAAAKLVGVGRPAFSNFINGRASTSQEMASRIEVAFGIPAQSLLDMQASFDAAQAKTKGAPPNVMRYVHPFLGIKARAIEEWFDRNIPARVRLSVFLRTLVNSTGTGLKKVDFPGNDDAERPGADGFIDAQHPTPWIPEGTSFWEFGTNSVVGKKANGDFRKSLKPVSKEERGNATFVFVTPRVWEDKHAWEKKQKAKGEWKDVRAYDAQDLEQWLEQSIAGQVWFANETQLPSNGVLTLDKCWADWAGVSERPLVGSFFGPAIEGAERAVRPLLSKPIGRPIVIMADSAEEALAFLAQLFSPLGGNELAQHRDKVLVFQEPGVLSKLALGTTDFIAVAANRGVEQELGPLAKKMHSIVIYPRNAANATPDVILEPLKQEAFAASLEEMGYTRDDITKYSNESGRSLTVLRRRLAKVAAITTPAWAIDHKTAVSLIPFLFVGAWCSTNTSDQTALAILANEAYEELEKECQHLSSLNDPPLWSVGIYRGVVSKIDLLFAISNAVTRIDLERYFDIARMVLAEDDPALDLPEEERWIASINGKSREFSGAFREGVSETLVLLAVHGNRLFQNRLGFNCEVEVARLVEELLTPLKTRTLEANTRDLMAYAEAAPDKFLSILEEDLLTATPQTYGLMRPAGTGVLGTGCPRSGLLWALESLAWNPDTLLRTALILARLAEIEIEDNWQNKPINSLQSIFRSWMPQTAADHDVRLQVFKRVAQQFPKVAWKICIQQLDTAAQMGSYSHKPRWRTDAHGFGQPFKTSGPVVAFRKEMVAMALNWHGRYSMEMLADLIRSLHFLSDEHQSEVWERVRNWAETAADGDKAVIREKIRVTVLSTRGVKRSKEWGFANLPGAAKAAYQALEPSDLLQKNAWLFRSSWLEESADEIHDEDMDFDAREKRVANLRVTALRKVFEERGFAGVVALAEMGEAAFQIGWLMTSDVLRESEISDFVIAALPSASSTTCWTRKYVIAGALHALQDERKRVYVLKKVQEAVAESDFVRVLLHAPFRRSTWHLVDLLDGENQQAYWLRVIPDLMRETEDENTEAVQRLLSVERPRAAFNCIHFRLETLDPELLFRLLSEIPKNGNDQPGQYQLEQHYIEKAFAIVDRSNVLTLEQKAILEFAYIDLLSKHWGRGEGYGLPNLEKYVEAHPEVFVQAVVWTYNRKDGAEDPPQFRVPEDRAEEFATRGWQLLEGLTRIPGHEDPDERQGEKLAAWINAVRTSCAELGRLEVADTCIGKLLSGAPSGKDGVWPCEAVRDVLEELHSKKIMRGASTGLYNSRGVHWRGEGGDQERALAAKYRAYAEALKYTHPFLAYELLMNMVKTYEHEAAQEDAEAAIRKRL